MTQLVLSDAEQAAVRAVLACEPVPDQQLPGRTLVTPLARLIDCDAAGMSLLDGGGGHPGAPAPEDEPRLGVSQRDRVPARDGTARALGVAALSYGVRNGADHVVKVWLIRRSRDFSERDRALLLLVAPALERLMRERPTSTLPPSLTVAERRVLRHVASGLTNAEIAEALFVEPCTVRKHLENAYRKLGVTNRIAAVLALEGARPRDRAVVDDPVPV